MRKVLTLITVLFFLSAPNAYSQICNGDFDCDNDVDGTDAIKFMLDFFRSDCPDCDTLAPVPKTGQITSYATGDDGNLEKGVEWPNPRFTDNGDETVTDNSTGLTWFKWANCIATDYPSFDNDGTAGDGAVTWQHALYFVEGINNGTYSVCGGNYTDWRLPNVRELQSIIHYGFSDPALPNTVGTGQWSEEDPFGNVQSNGYWSATTYVGSTVSTWFVYMDYGSVGYLTKSFDYYVWPVRGEPSAIITTTVPPTTTTSSIP
jgi:hypothetical protein